MCFCCSTVIIFYYMVSSLKFFNNNLFSSINVREFKFAQTMIFAIEEINQNPAILPNHRLGYKIYNSCGTTNIMMSAINLANGEKELIDEGNCTKVDTAHAILGHSGSAPTVGFARIIGRFQIPVVNILHLFHVYINRARNKMLFFLNYCYFG